MPGGEWTGMPCPYAYLKTSQGFRHAAAYNDIDPGLWCGGHMVPDCGAGMAVTNLGAGRTYLY